MNKNILEIRNLKTSFIKGQDQFKVIRGVDLEVKKGEILGIVGESGSGKSVTMKSLMSILPKNALVESDSMVFNDVDLNSLTEEQKRKLRGSGMSMIFQDPMSALNPLRTIGFHMEEVILRHVTKDKKKAREIAVEYLKKVGIPSPEMRLNQYPHEFSGGMRQRVLIAMGLSCEPELLIADEPTTALDVTIQAQILELLLELQKNIGMSIILITHDLGVVASMCQRIAVMYGGLIMEEGTIDEIFYNPKHPYTIALLESIPDTKRGSTERLRAIPGNAPSVSSNPQGCPFAPRCKFALDICSKELPKYKDFSESHRAMCFNFQLKEG